MDTFLKVKTGAPGDHIYTADEIISVYDSFGLQEEFVENISPETARALTPAEDPDQHPRQERRLIEKGYVLSSINDDDMDDEDDDEEVDDELDEADIEDVDADDISDDDIDDDLELDLDDDDEDDDDLI